MLVGVATRKYARSLEPVPATVRTRRTSKSAVSRRFVEAAPVLESMAVKAPFGPRRAA